ncbi:HTH domain protein [Tritonibacter multivorans]|uniref:HTH domain protein n=1 Tax=Tritonibacter multivorans TaxID=928856 RepID=A0A0P1G921_9RHOB|nr:WYL domain-containing protein [Tritonibacter multivorans]MDA7421746.1 WYL domain-containing protein [Tritonibacter multivorans]CUH77981.1 HTH domain protein [Tritonibacter multivorans]SFD04468.1 HTH domain-containing protein [Tritonibacter multivorans]
MELLAVQLKQDVHCTIKDLAQQHGVSTRTIARDLSVMREQGMQIAADRGRGGGVRLDRSWGVGRLNLPYAEAVDLLISISVAEQMKSPIFLASLASVRRQLVASFSPEKRKQVERLKSRILIGGTASTFVQAGASTPPKPVVQTLHQAFVSQSELAIQYQREDGEISNRQIAPHYLLLKYPIWYVLAFDRLRDRPRNFRCDRILSAQMTNKSFTLLPKDRFDPSVFAEDFGL